MIMRDQLIGAAIAALIVSLAAMPTPVRAAEPIPLASDPCMPYDQAIQKFADAGWTIMEDIVLPKGYEVDRLLVVQHPNGHVAAAPVVNGCVPPYDPIPLGLVVKRAGVPA